MAISEEWRRKRKDEGDANGLNTSGSMDTTTGGALPTNQDSTPTSGFVNLQQYLDTNKGAGAGIAGAYTGGLNKKVDEFKTSTDKTATETAAGINAAGDSHVQEGSNLIANLGANMTGDLTNTRNFVGKGYTPDTQKTDDAIVAGQTDINNQLGKVDDTATQQTGLMATFGKDNGNYGSGFAGLDRFIMGGDESGRAVVAKTKARTGEVTGAANNYGTMKSTATTAAQAKLAKAQKDVKDAALARKGSIETNNFGTRIAQKNATYGDNENAVGASIGDVMTSDERSYLDALAELGGGTKSTYGSTFKEGTKKAVIDPGSNANQGGYTGPTAQLNPAELAQKALQDNIQKGIDFTKDPTGTLSMQGARQTAADYDNNIAEANRAVIAKTTPVSINAVKKLKFRR
jgi:hypothetical protein